MGLQTVKLLFICFLIAGISFYLCLTLFFRWVTWTAVTCISSVCLPPTWPASGSRLRPVRLSCARSGRWPSQVKMELSHLNQAEGMVSRLFTDPGPNGQTSESRELTAVTILTSNFLQKLFKWNPKKGSQLMLPCLQFLFWLFHWCGNRNEKWGFSNIWPLEFQMEAEVNISVHNAAVEIASVSWTKRVEFSGCYQQLVLSYSSCGEAARGSPAAGCWCQGVNAFKLGGRNEIGISKQVVRLMLGCTSRSSCSCFFSFTSDFDFEAPTSLVWFEIFSVS